MDNKKSMSQKLWKKEQFGDSPLSPPLLSAEEEAQEYQNIGKFISYVANAPNPRREQSLKHWIHPKIPLSCDTSSLISCSSHMLAQSHKVKHILCKMRNV